MVESELGWACAGAIGNVIRLEFDGRPFEPSDFKEQLVKATMEVAAAQIQERLSAIRHPETGEFPTVVVMAADGEDIRVRVEGSPVAPRPTRGR